MRRIYYDSAQQLLKVSYQVKDTIENIPHGKYISYFPNGNMQSTGYFDNNKPVGDWQFFYETGKIKMTNSTVKDSSDYFLHVYYYKNEKKSAEGYMNEKERVGIWKIYFEDGILQSEIEYGGGLNRYTGYYHSGEVLSRGVREGAKNVGYWRFFFKSGTVSKEGYYTNGKKSGSWKYYYPSGKLSSLGNYAGGKRTGTWKHLSEKGKLNAQGGYLEGKKDGQWNTFDIDGNLQSKGSFKQGAGEVVQYYADGKIKARGHVKDDKKNERWVFLYEDGSEKGECDFDMGSGMYYGYYPDGTSKTKGHIKNDQRVGLWEIYDQKGTLTGYYRPFSQGNDSKTMPVGRETIPDYDKSSLMQAIPVKPSLRQGREGHFKDRFPEYRGVIVQSNPFFTFIGMLPVSMEFYVQNRMGYEFLFEILRNPFFKNDNEIKQNKIFKRGYDISIRQKFYYPIQRLGMWYFGHEIVFTSVTHASNMLLRGLAIPTMAEASEMRAEYGPILGIRFMWDTGRNGFTIDANAGLVIGYRNFTTITMYEEVFSDLNRSPFAYTFRFGVNFGYVLSANR